MPKNVSLTPSRSGGLNCAIELTWNCGLNNQSSGKATLSGHRARKRFGQHFLTDRQLIGDLIDQINPQSGEYLIEIGPGLGALTDELIDRVSRLTAVELDRDLAARLRERHPPQRLHLIQEDALKADWVSLTMPGQARLVGNLPYNISTPLLVRLIECREQVLDQHFMLQKEVVNRIVASRGADFGRLGILLQAFYRCDSVLDVPAHVFTPPPRVESAVVRMRTRAQPLVTDASDLQALLAVAFSQRRKMLRTTLLPWLRSRAVVHDEIEPTLRAEQIPAELYFLMAQRLTDAKALPAGNSG
ncbi:MAG: 16S rRNA (adenine(1518)-N(6)/adenine(1519)-N(6))-dimethyltransferase RsmA [Burkholderiaceae bacterium]